MFCIECNKESKHCKQSTLCEFCCKKMDKYETTSQTYIFVDLILLKRTVFRHFLLNQKITFTRFLRIFILQLIIHHIFVDSSFNKTPHLYLKSILLEITYILLVNLTLHFKSKMTFYKAIFVILFSSFFNYFKILMVLWDYNRHEYYFIVETLNCCSNIVALKIYEPNQILIIFTVLISKVVSHLIFKPEIFSILNY